LGVPTIQYAVPYTALTGIPITPEEIYLAGRRAANLEKAFNSRLGYTRIDDTVSERWLKEPLRDAGPTPPGMVDADYMDHTLTEYYMWQGWDPTTGLQRREVLELLDLNDVADVLGREGVLSE
jgi:aldehyde:ferredoxin oxidoreductase